MLEGGIVGGGGGGVDTVDGVTGRWGCKEMGVFEACVVCVSDEVMSR